MVHAYGDSYAHTYLQGGKEQAYRPPHGHAGDGHTPDKIGEFPEKYLAYVTNLFQAFGGDGEPEAQLDRLFQIVHRNKGENRKISSLIMSYATELGMTDENSDAVKDQLLKEISEKDVVDTMAIMQARFKRK